MQETRTPSCQLKVLTPQLLEFFRPPSLTGGQPTSMTDFPFLKIHLANELLLASHLVCTNLIKWSEVFSRSQHSFLSWRDREMCYLFSSLGKWPLLSQKCCAIGQGSFRDTACPFPILILSFLLCFSSYGSWED